MNKRLIDQYTLEGEYVQTFESSKAAARSVQGEGSSICQACMKNKPFRGYLWKYKIPLPPRRDKKEVLEELNLALLQDLEERIDKLPRYIVELKIKQIILNNDTINELMQEEPQRKGNRNGRPPIRVNQYNKDGQLLKTFNSIKEASEETKDPVDKIRATLNGKLGLTPHGFYYTKVDAKTKQKETKDDEDDKETIDENFFYIPRDKENRKKMLKNYIESRLGTYMMHLTKHQQILERKFLQTIIKSL